ncbi:MAG: tyrosine-type recombinase/integrase [Candidatus Asgardarchaeia archaeon]
MKKIKIMSYDDVKNIINSIKNKRDKALVELLYLTGARISELLSLRRGDIEEDKVGDVEFLFVNLITLKRKKGVEQRVVEIPKFEISNETLEYIYSKGEDDLLFESSRNKGKPISRIHAWRIIKSISKDLYLHLMRHCRLTHLVNKYNYNELELMRFAGWTNTNPAKFYMYQSAKDRAKKVAYLLRNNH